MSQTTMQTYAVHKVYVNDRLSVQHTNLTIKRTSNIQKQHTVNLGLSGGSPGAAEMEISIDFAEPAVGMEFDFGTYIANVVDSSGRFVKLTIVGNGNKTLTGDFMVMDDDIAQGVDTNAKQTVNFAGPMQQWV